MQRERNRNEMKEKTGHRRNKKVQERGIKKNFSEEAGASALGEESELAEGERKKYALIRGRNHAAGYVMKRDG